MPKFEHTIALLDRFLAAGTPGYDFTLRRHGEVLLRRTEGFSDREAGIPMTGRERFNLYSCSKLITCSAALQLMERGLFRLDDELGEYMPEFSEMKVRTPSGEIVPARSRITIRHLFTMTAGFNYNLSLPAILRCYDETHGAAPTRECIRRLAEEPLDFEPGSGWQYSLCHDVLAALVEVIAGMPFNDYVTQHIFLPLGMKDSTFLLPAAEFPTVAGQYRYFDGAVVPIGPRNPYRLGADYASGGAGCVSTMEDYMRFLEALREGDRILGRETIRLMASPQLTSEKSRRSYAAAYGEKYSYGLGVRCPFAEGSGVYDFGWGGAAGAYLFIDPEHDLVGFYLQHVLGMTPARPLRVALPGTVLQDLGL